MEATLFRSCSFSVNLPENHARVSGIARILYSVKRIFEYDMRVTNTRTPSRRMQQCCTYRRSVVSHEHKDSSRELYYTACQWLFSLRTSTYMNQTSEWPWRTAIHRSNEQ